MMLELDDEGVVREVNEEDLIYVDKKAFDEFVEEYNHLKKENEELKLLIKKVLETTPIEHSLAIDLKNSIKELYK